MSREDGSLLIGYFDKPDCDSFPITLIIPGSQKETSRRLHDSLKEALLAINQCPVTLEKRGISEDRIYEKEFNRFLTHEDRLEDCLTFLHKGQISGWDGSMVIMGQGDGGRIGASLATQTPHTKALILIAAGGAWSPQDEALYSFRTEMADEGYTPQYIHGFLTQAKQEFAQALKNPKPEAKAFGYSHRYWASLLKTNLIQDLSKLTCPIYSVNGVKDERVPIESVDCLAKNLKLTLIRKEDRGREIIQNKQIYDEAISWLEIQHAHNQ